MTDKTPLIAAGDALFELLENALGVHIYDYDQGEGPDEGETCPYEEALAAWTAAKAEPVIEPTGYEEPEQLPDRFFRVRYFMRTTTIDRHSVVVRANSAEEAGQRVEAWQRGEIDLTDAEELTEGLEKELGVDDSEFSELAQDEWDAPEEVEAAELDA